MQDTILIVDDNPDIRAFVRTSMEAESYRVIEAANGVEAMEKFHKDGPSLVILDIGIGQPDGFEVCRMLRKVSVTPIIMLTTRGDEVDEAMCLAAGADDYINKPIKPKLLVSKVKALLRRLKSEEKQNSETLNVGGIEINREEYKIIKDDIEIVLPRKEFELFYLLASKPGKVFKREEILDKVWGNDVIVGGRTIDVHIRKLREKIGDDFFKTIKGVGYKFEV